MARGDFVMTCDLYAGPGAIVPGLYATAVPCRVVQEDGISPIGTGSPSIPRYLICDAEVPVGSWLTGLDYGSDPSLADQVAVPSGAPVSYWVIYVDKIDWLGQPVYYRAYLVPLPLPSIPTGAITYWLDTFTDAASVNLTSHVGENTPGGYSVPTGSFVTDGAGSVLATFSSNLAYFEIDTTQTSYRLTVNCTVPFNTATRIFVVNFRSVPTFVNFWQVQIAWAGLSHTSGTINLYSYTASVPTLVASSTGVVFDGAVVVTIDDDGNNLLITANGKSVANASTLWAGQTTQDIAFVDALNSGGWSVEYLKVEPIPP